MASASQLSSSAPQTTAVALVCAVVSLLITAASPVDAQGARSARDAFHVKVSYNNRSCTASPQRVVTALPGALIQLRQGSTVVAVGRLNAAGNAAIRAAGAGPYEAWVVLDGRTVAVRDVDAGGLYEFKVGVVSRGGRAERTLVGMEEAGAANIFKVLSQSSTFARRATPKAVPKVTAMWLYGTGAQKGVELDDRFGTSYEETATRIHIAKKYVFDPVALHHEYGHHVLQQIAPPGPKADGDHIFTQVYPSRMELPWSEGFANGYAALAMGTATPRLRCHQLFNFASAQAEPSIEPIGHLQFGAANEVTIGAAVWDLAHRFGSGAATPVARAAGLRKLLRAVMRRRHAVGQVRNIRQVHDSIMVDPALAASHQASVEIEQIFARRDIGWGLAVSLTESEMAFAEPVDTRDEGKYAHRRYTLTLAGPNMTCTALWNPGTPRDAHQYGYPTISVSHTAPGGLPRSGLDDCIALDEFMGAQHVRLMVPFDAADPHHGDTFTVTASYSCDSTPEDYPESGADYPITWHMCTSDRLVRITLGGGASASVEMCEGSPLCWGGDLHGVKTDLLLGNAATIATFQGDGWCRAPRFGPFDCSTGG